MKLHKLHFTVKFFKARAMEKLTVKCTEFNFIPMSTKRQPSSSRHRRGFLGCLFVDRTGQDRTEQDRTGQHRTAQDPALINNS